MFNTNARFDEIEKDVRDRYYELLRMILRIQQYLEIEEVEQPSPILKKKEK